MLDKISDQAGPEIAEYMKVTEGDGTAVLALQDDYRGKLESGGDLGSSDDYQKVIEQDEAQMVLFVSFDADDDWLVRVTEGHARGQREPRAPVGLRRQRLGRRRRRPRPAQGHHGLTRPAVLPPARDLSDRWWRSPLR